MFNNNYTEEGEWLTDAQNKETKETEEVHATITSFRDKIATIEEERDDFRGKVTAIEKENTKLKVERDALKEDRDALKTKFSALTSKLRNQIECPVCLEVPTSGPVHCCPNGHFVCTNCKDFYCPSCRSRMFNGKSVLAVTVIDNIEHECRNEDCEELLPIAEYKIHLKSCPHRVVFCPAPKERCGKKMSLSKVYDHIVSECEGSLNKGHNKLNDGKFPVTMTLSSRKGIPLQKKSSYGLALDWNGAKFYLNCEKAPDYNVFSVQLLESGVDCKDYEATITVHSWLDKAMEGKHVLRLVQEPFPVDIEEEERKKNGLMVGYKMMEKITENDGDQMKFNVTVNLK